MLNLVTLARRRPGRSLRDHLVAGFFRLVIGHLRREAGGEDGQARGVLQPADDVGRQFPARHNGQSVIEDLANERRDLQRHAVALGDALEKAHILFHQVHGEGNIARAVQDDLAFGHMAERCCRRKS